MTELLERVMAQLKTLPADEQDAIAARFLAEQPALRPPTPNSGGLPEFKVPQNWGI